MPSKAKRGAIPVRPQLPSTQPAPAAASASPASTGQEKVNLQLQQASLPNGQGADPTGDTTESAGEPNAAPAVNRKKQKRRAKEAAKKAQDQQVPHPKPQQQQQQQKTTTTTTTQQSQQPKDLAPQPNGNSDAVSRQPPRGPPKGYFTQPSTADYASLPPQDYADVGSTNDHFYSGDEDLDRYPHPGQPPVNSSWLSTSKRKKAKKKKAGQEPSNSAIPRASTTPARSNFPAVSNAALRSAHRMGDSLWNPSTQAERENIKQFWLGLGEDERRSLVKIEKEAVLRKMKEQQKHSCSCSVCGRKRTAIEEELEVLYDAYYEELEQFANHNPGVVAAPQLVAPPRSLQARSNPRPPIPGSFSPRGRVEEVGDDEDEDEDEDLEDEDEEEEEDEDEDDEDEDEDDEDDEPYSDEDVYYHHGLPPGSSDFLQFGNSLTVKGLPSRHLLTAAPLILTDGILTVADDLLKNDGRHFIDMMEQLAERRMAREEEVHFPAALTHQDAYQGHNHVPSDEEDDGYDDEDDDDYDSQEEEDFEGDDMDSMTEEQRMEEGRRMFQIFAARMFEQRVLTAYREKVAAERQAKLLEELEEEDRLDTQREQKKAREAAKKKEKKKAQKLAKEEEKAKKEAEKAAQEAAAREAEEKKQEEQRLRREEQRKKREAERKAAEEERLRKEAEKQKRIQEQKERQAEAERRQREAKERERQKKEAAKKKEREEREAREQEARQRKAQEAEERRQKEEQARKAREAAAAAARLDEQVKSQQQQQQPPRAQPVALPPGLLPPQRPAQLQSPSFPIASPVVPAKVPTPVRNRQPSHSVQTAPSHASSPRSQKAATDMSSASPASGIVSQSQLQPLPNKTPIQPPMLHHPQPSAPRSPLNNGGRGQYSFSLNGLPGYAVGGGPPTSAPGLLSTMLPQAPLYQGPPIANARYGPNGMHFHPAFGGGGPRHFPPGQHPMPFQPQTTGAPPLQQGPVQPPQPLHSRQASGSTTAEAASQPAPIARPPPGAIGKPPSTTPDRKQKQGQDQDVDQITTALGSKALLDDSDEPIPTVSERSNLVPLGAPGTGRLPFASSFADGKQASFGGPGQSWGGFGGAQGWGAPASQMMGASWPQQPFGSLGGIPPPVHRPHVSRPFAVRILLAQACRQLSITGETWHPAQAILHHVNVIKSPNEAPISMDEMLGLAETEGNAQNGGGSFELADHGRGVVIKFVEDSVPQPRNSVGDIGSPLPHHSQPTPFPSGQSAFGLPGRGF